MRHIPLPPDYPLTVHFPPGEQGRRRRWMVRQAVYGEVLDALDLFFSGWGIEYMPIKGAHLICAGIAGNMAVREMIDIDLLVRPTDFIRSVAFFSTHPCFTREPPDPWRFEQSFLYRHGNHKVRFELHCALNRPERFSLDVDAMFDRALLQTAVRRIMSAEDALIVLIGHTLVHLVEGVGEQVYEDAALLLQEPGFSWTRFSTILQTTGIERFGKALLTLAAKKREFPLPAPLVAPPLIVALLAIKTPRRGKGLRTMLFRGAVELFFVKNPAGMVGGYLRKWR